MSLADEFLRLGDYSPETKQTRFVCSDEFVGPYEKLKCGNGGSWCRFDGFLGKHYKLITIKRNGTIRYSWDLDDSVIEKREVEKDVDHFKREHPLLFGKASGTDIVLFRVYGTQVNDGSRAIRKDIRDAVCKLPCVVCGCTTNVECDHKNDLYNDSRVNCVNTQVLDDFQPLCKHCNDQKRQVVKKTKETGKRYGATSIPSLKALGVPDFTVGTEEFDRTKINALVGTYWYDPVDFMMKVRKRV